MYAGYTERTRWDYPSPTSRRAASSDYHQFGNGVLYAARFPDGAIKFGFTTQVSKRLTNLIAEGGGHPEVLAIKAGTYTDEQDLHASLAAHRRRGREWYNPDAEVMAVVNEWRADLRRDPLDG